MHLMSRARMLLGRPRTAACCAVLGLAVAAGMAGAVTAAAQPGCTALRCATAANHFAAPVPTTPQVASNRSAAPSYLPAAATGGMPTGPAPRP